MAALVGTQLSLLEYLFIIALYRFTQYAINCICFIFFFNKIGEITNMLSLLLSCIHLNPKRRWRGSCVSYMNM